MASTAMPLPQIVDGFSYDDQLLYLSNRSFVLMLEAMSNLRRASQYRVREWCLPDNQNVPIAPFDTFYGQIEVAGGSYLWGHNFAAISATDSNGSPVETTATNLLLQLVDSCSGVPLFQDYANAGVASSTSSAPPGNPILLSKPRIILDPGLVNVYISNRTPNNIVCQWRLRFAESCRRIDEVQREHFYKMQAEAR